MALAPPAQRSFYLPGLDGLRVVAWFMVFCSHALPQTVGSFGPEDQIGALWRAVVMGGAMGVPLFFALSAFLITCLLEDEKALSQTVKVGNFYARRVLRIWPLYFAIIAISVVASPHLPGTFPIDRLGLERFATFTANFEISARCDPHSPLRLLPLSIALLWSVCVEEQFYAVWPWLVKLLNRKGMTTVAIAMIVAGTCYRVDASIHSVDSEAIWFNSLAHLDSFGYGCLAALHLRGIALPGTKAKYGIMLSGFATILLVMRYVPLKGVLGPAPLDGALSFTVISAASALIVWSASTLSQGGLASPPVAAVGRITYGLYCYHGLIILFVIQWIPRGQWLLEFPVMLMLSLAVASLSYRFYERPFLRLRRRFQAIRSGSD